MNISTYIFSGNKRHFYCSFLHYFLWSFCLYKQCFIKNKTSSNICLLLLCLLFCRINTNIHFKVIEPYCKNSDIGIFFGKISIYL